MIRPRSDGVIRRQRALVVERPARGGDGAVDVLGLALGDLAETLLGRRVERLERLAADRLDPLAVDQQTARLATKSWACWARPSGRSANVCDEAAPLVGRFGAEMDMIGS